jgi:predicted AlkP superfamily phosphohydrolase/phosphomutase
MKLLNDIPSRTHGAGASTRESPKAKADFVSTVRNWIPKSWRVAVSRTVLPRRVNEKLSLRWKTAGIAWEHTRAFLIENANEGYIRINLQGREPQGIVAPGAEYDALCEELYQTIKGMTNPANGKPAALTVHKTADLYQGPCRSHMPDIIVNWDDDAQISTQLLTEHYGVARSPEPGYGLAPYYTGNHRPNAFSVAVGSGIAPGAVLHGASIMDLAPTLLSHFDIDLPDYMHGRVLPELGVPLSSPSGD